MVTIVRPEKFNYEKYKDILFGPLTKTISVFLAGGINNNHWQDKTIEIIKDAFDKDEYNIFVFTPTISDDISDSDRWTWESEILPNSDLYAFYFENNGSDHPMTCFELGTVVGEYAENSTIFNKIILTIESGYKLERNITENVINRILYVHTSDRCSNDELIKYLTAQRTLCLNGNPEMHGKNIVNKINEYRARIAK
jgi:hypothetical protein